MPLFETIKTNAGTQPKHELQQWALVWQLLLWCLLRNCEEMVVKLLQPPSAAEFFFVAISCWIIHFWIISAQLIIFQKNYPNIFHLTLSKKSQVFSANVRVIFKKSWEMYNSARNGIKNVGGFAAVSLQFLNKHFLAGFLR